MIMSNSYGSPRSVMMYLSHCWGGGTEVHVYLLALELLRRGAAVTLAVHPNFPSTPERRSALHSAGAEFVWLSKVGGPRRATALARLTSAFWRLRGRRFDVVIAHGNGATNYYVRHFARSSGTFVWHDHFFGAAYDNSTADCFEPPVLTRFQAGQRRTALAADVVVVGSEAGASNLRKIQGRRRQISVAPPLARVAAGLATDRMFSQESVLRFGLFAATLDHRKGAPQLLNLWNGLDVGACELHFWGEDPGSRLEEKAQREGLSNVYFHGAFQPRDLPQLMHATDIGLVLSLHEGYPLAVWEFMAFGVPFVVTPTGAAVEFTRDNPDCELAGFSPQDITDAIEKIAKKVRSGHTSRQRLQQLQESRFSFEAAVEKHLSYCFPLGAAERVGQASSISGSTLVRMEPQLIYSADNTRTREQEC